MKRAGSGSCAALAGWLLAAGLVVGMIAALVVGALAWQQQAGELARLRAQVEELAAGSREAEVRRVAVQSTAAALDGRLAALDRAVSLAASATPETPDVSGPEAWAELSAAQAELVARIETLEQQVSALAARMDAAAQAPAEPLAAVEPDAEPAAPSRTLPDTIRLEVERQKQHRPLSCESSAASMAARYHGVDVSEEDVLAALPRHDNPHLGFRGNVDGAPGGTDDYGVYAAPLAAVLIDHGLDARLVEGGLAGIQAALVRGNPVVAWVTYDCLVSTPVTVTVDGEQVVLVPYQHAVVVTGYDAGGVWANDPWDGGQDYYSVADFDRAMGYFGDMAIEVAARGG